MNVPGHGIAYLAEEAQKLDHNSQQAAGKHAMRMRGGNEQIAASQF